MFFQYTNDCIVGVEQIDVEHQYLFTLMNQLMEAVGGDSGTGTPEGGSAESTEDLEKFVERLIEYGEVHFAHEEEYLEKTGDREYGRQKRDHAMFLNRMRSLDMMDLNDDEKRKLLKDTLVYLTKWLYSHILGSDTLIGKVEHIAEQVKEEEEYCLFTEKYMTGIASIDEEHKGLFAIIGKVYRMVEEGFVSDHYDDIMSLLDQLEEYTEVHFSHEEEHMEQIGYPQLAAQRRAHAIFLERLEDKDFGENQENQQEYLEELLDFLFAWLGNHILKMDKLIGQYKG